MQAHKHVGLCSLLLASWLIWSTLHQHTDASAHCVRLPRAISGGASPAQDYQQQDASWREPSSLLTYSYVFTLKASALVFVGGLHHSWIKNSIWGDRRWADETDRHGMPAEMWLKEQQEVEVKHRRSANKATGLAKQREEWGNLSQSMWFLMEQTQTSGSIVIAAVNLCSD